MSWSCSRCETINPDTVDICEVCDTKKIHDITSISHKKEEHPIPTVISAPAPTPKSPNLAWILTIIFGAASFILFAMYSNQDQELQSIRRQLNDAKEQLNSQVDVDSAVASAVASAEANLRATILGQNYYRVTLTDFYNAKNYPIKNIDGDQIGELYVSYGWAFMENDKPVDIKSLVTTRVIFNIYNESTNGYYGFSTSMQDKYDTEERHIPIIGSTYYAETSNYKMAIRVIDYKKDQETSGWDEPAFGTLTLDIVISNK